MENYNLNDTSNSKSQNLPFTFSIKFDTGVKLNITESEIFINWEKGKFTAKTKDISGLKDNLVVEPRISPATLLFRFYGILFVLALIVAAFGDSSLHSRDGEGFGYSIIGIFLILSFGVLVTIIEVLDALLFQFSIAYAIIRQWFSDEYILVSIQNAGGKPLEFLISPSEKNKLTSVRKALDEAQNVISKKLVKSDSENNPTKKLLQLKELLDCGIITQEEFNEQKIKLLSNF